MTWDQVAVWTGAIGGLIGGIVGGVVMPIVLLRMNEARGWRARIEALLRHLDECLETKTESLRSQINGVHLEVAREYAPRQELRDLEVDLRAEIGQARQLARIEGAVQKRS